MLDGYMGQFLYINLTNQTHKTLTIPKWLKDEYVGGKGFGAKLLYDLTEPGIDPLGPNNPLMFLSGPLTGTSAPAIRGCVVCKSPATNLFLDSYYGGRFSAEIKYAGYDGLIILGKSSEPTYLWIYDNHVEFKSAENIWGTDSIAANQKIKQELNDDDVAAVTIGPAGENMVNFALINCEFNRQAGRGGAGAVMGSKQLKGIALKGSQIIKPNDPKQFAAVVQKARKDIEAKEDCSALTDAGTSYAVPWASEVGLLPYRNHTLQHDLQVAKIDDTAQKKHIFLGKSACLGCPIRCSQIGAVRTGKFAPFVTDIVEYESVAMIGSNLMISNIRDIAYLTKLCDNYGMDSISMGGVAAFAMEAAENGLIEQPEEVELAFGSTKAAEYIIKSVAFQNNNLGRLLGMGVKKAAQEIGKNASDYALHVKGLEIPGWSVRGAPGMGLAYATADRGGCHQRGFMIGYEYGGNEFNGTPVEPHSTAMKADILVHEQNYISGLDTLIKCDFGSYGVSEKTYIDMLNAVTGRCESEGFIGKLGNRIWNWVRLYNLREGVTNAEDTLPKRIIKEKIADGPQKGQCISQKDLDDMIADFYRIRGWDSEGRPPITIENNKVSWNEEPLSR